MGMISEMPASEKPREKALKYGIRTLSARELLAIVLRSGTKGCSVLETADELLKMADGISGLTRLSVQEICCIKGISKVKALELQACFEVSRRAMAEQVYDVDVVDHPEKLIRWLQADIGTSMQEKFMVVYLDNSHRILSCRTLFTGTINTASVYPREIFREALLLYSTDIMLVHNHPSGELSPSMADLNLTDRLLQAGRLMGIRVLDHLIITRSGYLSFAGECILGDVEETA